MAKDYTLDDQRERIERAIKLKVSGLTYAQIAAELGISRQRVQQIVSPPPAIKKLIATRAGGKCEICGIPLNGRGHVHHKGGDSDYNDMDNLTYLCALCHLKEHGRYEDMTLALLSHRVQESKDRRKKQYKLARELGFSADESIVLQGHSEETIRRLAQEKNKQEGK